ncbi:MAG: macro domain-containing protein, partial [Calditrichaeota bacterium]
VKNSLRLANKHGLKTLSMPAISAGIFGFPKDRCARIILNTITDFFRHHPDTSLEQVRVCLYDQPTLQAFVEAFEAMEQAPQG